MAESRNVKPASQGSGILAPAFVFFHSTSVNGTAMAIAATIASYFSLYAQETVGITTAQLAVILLICNSPATSAFCASVSVY
jgi:hypothetical protein